MNDLITLDNLNKAKDLIQQANVSQLKEIIARADALKVYAQQAKKGLEIQNQVAEVKLRAEKRIGDLLRVMPKNKGSQGKGVPLQDVSTPTFKELGIEHIQSHRWQQVASLPDKDFEEHIKKVKESNEELTTIGIIKLARQVNQPIFKEPPKLPKGEFDVILADPPWKYDFAPQIESSIEQHYPTMETEDICQLKIPAAKNSVLFLWATAPKLEEAFKVLNAWGFSYKTCAVWDKKSTGMGYWFLGQHELLLVGTKGNFSPPTPENRVASLYSELKTKHSKKPDYFYQLIERMFPRKKYLELFARQKYGNNWECWGNQTA